MANLGTGSSVLDWTGTDINEWLESIDLLEYSELFKEHSIDGYTLLFMTENDLRNPPLSIKVSLEFLNSLVLLNRITIPPPNFWFFKEMEVNSYILQELYYKFSTNFKSSFNAGPKLVSGFIQIYLISRNIFQKLFFLKCMFYSFFVFFFTL